MRILIADDHELLRDVLRSYLEAEGEFVIGAVATLPARSLVNAIRFMAVGETCMLIDLHRPSQSAQASPSGLPPPARELQVLAGLCAGHSDKEIGRDLNLREPTIKLHVKTICRKLIARERSLC